MPVARYDTPAKQEFINTYAPMPFDEMAGALQYKQQQYQQGAATVDAQIRSIDQLQAIPDSEDENQLNQAKRQLHQVALTYSNRDLSDPLIRRQLDNEIRSVANPEQLNRIQQSYQGYQMYNKSLAELKQKGQALPDDFLQKFEDYSTEGSGVFAGLPEARLDSERAIKDFLSTVKPEFIGEVELPSGRLATKQGVKLKKLLDHIEKGSGSLMSDPRVAQLLDIRGQSGDLDALKTILTERAPAYTSPTLTGGSFRPRHYMTEQQSSIGSGPLKVDLPVEGRGKSTFVMAEKIIENASIGKEQALNNYNQLIAENANKEEVESARMIVNRFDNEIKYYQDRIQDTKEPVDAKYNPLIEQKHIDLQKMLKEEGMTEEDLGNLIERAYSATALGIPAFGAATYGAEKNIRTIVNTISKIPAVGPTGTILKLPSLEDILGEDDYLLKHSRLIGKVHTIMDLEKEKQKEYKDTFEKENSLVETQKGVLMPQMSFVSGIAYIGPAKEGNLAAFSGQIIPYMKDHPEGFELKALSDNIKNKKVEQYIKRSDVKPTAARFLPNADGTVTVYLDLAKTDKKGSIKENGTISFKVKEETQINALADDFEKGGDPITADRLRPWNRQLATKIEMNKWAESADYNFIDSATGQQLDITVKYDDVDNKYKIYRNNNLIDSASTTGELEDKLYFLQDAASRGVLSQAIGR